MLISLNFLFVAISTLMSADHSYSKVTHWNHDVHKTNSTPQERVQALHNYRYNNMNKTCDNIDKSWAKYACTGLSEHANSTMRAMQLLDPYEDQDESRWNWNESEKDIRSKNLGTISKINKEIVVLLVAL